MSRYIVSVNNFDGAFESNTYLRGGVEYVNHSQRLNELQNSDLTVDEYLLLVGDEFKAVEQEELYKLLSDYYKSKYPLDKLTEIDSDTFNYMLDVLPPLQWKYREGQETFLMSEFMTGSITTQFIRTNVNGKDVYYKKFVDTQDPETFFNINQLSKK